MSGKPAAWQGESEYLTLLMSAHGETKLCCSEERHRDLQISNQVADSRFVSHSGLDKVGFHAAEIHGLFEGFFCCCCLFVCLFWCGFFFFFWCWTVSVGSNSSDLLSISKYICNDFGHPCRTAFHRNFAHCCTSYAYRI